ncbi:Sec-independent protein translocase protein TatC [Methylacidimicrobium cyclopophantes]|uniref:Sec-independent protein translocase protein TatC n=1 Tax=Methylacidimicrobium cyclopophantes TaxID=1041766 RepID=A0A5E6MC83_9BACT|nr:twin-arginine translocase subunit TatC [Methylacidimicrobium cyclopophantes]VVM05935.1 Sec-independent protein translocase protein TatC [Methylacidimicrobium cyclopophantes]
MPPSSDEKPFLDHLEDLRWMLFKASGALVLAAIVGFVETKPILELLLAPLRKAGEDPTKILRVLGVVDPFSVQIQISLLTGIVLSLPAVLYFVGEFLLPALTPGEKRAVLPVFSVGALLFLLGGFFSYAVLLPQTLRFFVQYSRSLGVENQWTLPNYVDFVIQMVVGFGLAFELPLVVVLLTYFGILRAELLGRYRRHAIVAIIVAAACITPTSDPFTLFLLAAPMYLLYELSVWIAIGIERKKSPRLSPPALEPGFKEDKPAV